MRRYCSRIVWAAVVCGFGVFAPQSAHAGPNVLLLWDDDALPSVPTPSDLNASTQALITAMEAAGLKVTLSDTTQAQYNGNNPAPDAFDAVIHLNGNGNVLDLMQSVGAIATLVSYVENDGGGFINSENTESQISIPLVGLNALMEELMVLDRGVGAPPAFGTITLAPVVGFESHPLLTGLTQPFSFEGGRMVSAVRSTYVTDPATAILRDEFGYDAAAVRELGAGRVVSFHHTGNFRNSVTLSDTLQDTDVQRLYINAVLWADQHAPTATIESEQARANAAGAGFLVRFSEGVDGFDETDLQLLVGGGLAGPVSTSITALNDRDFRVFVAGYSGVGTLQLNLLDDDTLVDQSFNANPYAGVGTLNGPVCPADTVAPSVSSFSANPSVIPLAGQGEFTLVFNEDMDTAYPPLLRATTLAGGIIEASPLVPPPSGRATTGLLAFYDFEEGVDGPVHDTSGVGTPLNLNVSSTANTSWVDGGLSIDAGTLLLSGSAATKISSACVASNAVTFEAWIRPLNATQAGPARIASIGVTSARNLTLEQDAAAYKARLRTTSTSSNGLPELSAVAQVDVGALQHVVFTHAADGTTRIYVDNTLAVSSVVGGNFSGWNSTYRLALGNELNNAFPWLGEFHMFAVYDRALSAAEVEQNFDTGPTTVTPGNGEWLNPTTYRVSLDRAVDFPDEGAALVSIVGARDLAGNLLTPQANRPVAIISTSLVIDTQPSGFYLREAGVPFEFVVGVSGAVGGLDYQWYKEDAAKVFAPVGANAPVLAFVPLEIEDSGTYFCVISDVQASVQTAPSQLDVVASLPVGGVVGLLIAGVAVALVGARRRRATN